MPITTEKDLSETQRPLWLKAIAAIEFRNFGYAISLLRRILRQSPLFLAGRQLLRRAEIARCAATPKSFFHISLAPLLLIKIQRKLKKDPTQAIEMSEKILENEPYHRRANLALRDAAVAAGWPEIGVFALQTLLEKTPGDVKILHALGRLYRDLEQNEQEVDVYNRITEIDPFDADALHFGKEAAARAAMVSGGWLQAKSYRDLIQER
jgi:tetratricopeptide (TPR) repeat protein